MLVNLENTTKKLCIIGDPVLHSKSPLIQNTMLRALGLDYVYLAQTVPRGGAAAWLSAAKTAGYAGFNATMPHKLDLVPLLDELDEDAALIGAVNTVCLREDGFSVGHNTDGMGFLRALADAGLAPEGARVVLLGAGGAAQAVALKLVQAGAGSVTVCNRTLAKAEELCARGGGHLIPAGFSPATLRRLSAEADLLVNCTCLGMNGVSAQFEDFSFLEALKPEAAVCDLIYAPAETELLSRARARGLRTLNGLGMLVHQAICALEFFTGERLDGAAMRRLLESLF